MGFMKILADLVTSTLNSGTYLSGSELNTSQKEQKLIKELLIANEEGESGLYRAIWNQRYDKNGALKIHLDALEKAGFFDGSSAAANKKLFIDAVFNMAKWGGSVLIAATGRIEALQQILTALDNADCFKTEHNQQAFIDALINPGFLGKSALHFAAQNFNSLKLINDYLKKTNCYNHPENKQKLIDAIFLPDLCGENALFNACMSERNFNKNECIAFLLNKSERNFNKNECIALLLEMLTCAGCFDGMPGSKNQQAFVNAVFAENSYQMNLLFHSRNDSQILNQLMKINYLEGPFADLNKQNLTKALFSTAKIGQHHQGNAFAANSSYQSLPIIMEHLTAADCFSAKSPYSKQFIQAVIAKAGSKQCMLSKMYHAEKILLLLNKLTEAGCFNDETTKKQFRDAVRADGNAILFNVIKDDCRAYLKLHQCLIASGFTAQDIKQLLNEPVAREFDCFKVATPLMRALGYKYNLLAARLMVDGAELTESQKQQVQVVLKKKQQYAESPVVPLDRATVKRELLQTEKNAPYKKPKLEKSASLSDLSLFAEKKSASNTQCDTRDDVFIKRIPLC